MLGIYIVKASSFHLRIFIADHLLKSSKSWNLLWLALFCWVSTKKIVKTKDISIIMVKPTPNTNSDVFVLFRSRQMRSDIIQFSPTHLICGIWSKKFQKVPRKKLKDNSKSKQRLLQYCLFRVEKTVVNRFLTSLRKCMLTTVFSTLKKQYCKSL